MDKSYFLMQICIDLAVVNIHVMFIWYDLTQKYLPVMLLSSVVLFLVCKIREYQKYVVYVSF